MAESKSAAGEVQGSGTGGETRGEGRGAPGTVLSVLRSGENGLVVLCLATMVLLPLIEASMRRLFNEGVPGASTIVQHLCLVLSMVGGAIAARENRLLALSTFSEFLKGRWKWLSQVLGHGFGAAIAMTLCVASAQYVMQERTSGNIFAYGIPRWVLELVMPLGFGLISVRLLWKTGSTWGSRLAAVVLCGVILLIGMRPPTSPENLVIPGLLLLLVATLAGAPVFAVLGGAAVIMFWGRSEPLAVLPIDHYQLVVNVNLPTIPLFTLAGYFLAEGGAAKRLMRVSQAVVGHFRGGPAIAAALACAFFTSFTGASGVTILALGGLVLPMLIGARYTEKNALGFITGAGSLGMLFPPCVPLVLYAIVANVELGKMFAAGLLPGVLLVALTGALGIWQAPRGTALPPFRLREVLSAVNEAKWELAVPVVALAGLFGGVITALDTAALTAFYAFCVEVFIYRELKPLKDVPRVMTECALLVGGVILILGVALGFTDYLLTAEVPDKLLAWVQASIQSPLVFLLVLNLFLLLAGCLIDVYSAIVVVVPLLLPLGVAYGIDPLHLGIIFLANMELGFLTPPVGMNLFLSSYRFNKPIGEVAIATLPILLVLLFGVLLITYVPWMTTFLPGLMK